jgi:hypothetical protein
MTEPEPSKRPTASDVVNFVKQIHAGPSAVASDSKKYETSKVVTTGVACPPARGRAGAVIGGRGGRSLRRRCSQRTRPRTMQI